MLDQKVPTTYLEADSILAEIRTNANSLSIWKASNDTDINDVILAFACNLDSFSRITVIAVDDALLDGLDINPSEGDTPAGSINELHCDVNDLNYDKLSILIKAINISIMNDRVISKSKSQVRDLLIEAVKLGRIKLCDVSNELSNKILCYKDKNK